MRHSSPQSLARHDAHLVEGMVEVFQPDPTDFERREVQGVPRWLESGLDRFCVAAPEILLPQLVMGCSSSPNGACRPKYGVKKTSGVSC